MEKPLVSVIMPAYNAERYIGLAIESILRQTYENLELIIIDDCSQDNTMNIVNQFIDSRIRIFHNKKNQGISYSRNYALEVSQGKYIAIMDDDDVSFDHRLEKQVTFLENNTDIGVVGGRVESIDENDNLISTQDFILKNPYYIKVNFLFRCIFHNSEVMFRKSIVDEYGICYRENCYGMEDFRFWIECSKVAKMTNLDDFMLKHRYYEGTETSRVKREQYPERIRCFDQLQQLSFRLSGFELSEEEYKYLNLCFREGDISAVTEEEIKKVFLIMKKTMHQAEDNSMDFVKELDIYYRKAMGEFIRKSSNLWG